MYNAPSIQLPGKLSREEGLSTLEHIRLFYRLAVALNKDPRSFSAAVRSLIDPPRPGLDADIPPVIANPSVRHCLGRAEVYASLFPDIARKEFSEALRLMLFDFRTRGLFPPLCRRARLDPNIPG